MAGEDNDIDGARKLFLYHRYACPELLAILEEEINVLAGGTCRKNRKGVPVKDDSITPQGVCERGTFK